MLDFLDAVEQMGVYIARSPRRWLWVEALGVERAIGLGASLIITVDNGISAFEALEVASARGGCRRG